MTTRCRCRHTRRHPRGQSLVEFALVLPVLILIIFAFVQILLVVRTQATLSSIASAAARQVAGAGGETPEVDRELRALVGQNGLQEDRLTVEIDTEAGQGRPHPLVATGPSDAPPPAGYNGEVTVRLFYSDPLLVPFFGTHTWTIPASASDASTGSYGGLAP